MALTAPTTVGILTSDICSTAGCDAMLGDCQPRSSLHLPVPLAGGPVDRKSSLSGEEEACAYAGEPAVGNAGRDAGAVGAIVDAATGITK